MFDSVDYTGRAGAVIGTVVFEHATALQCRFRSAWVNAMFRLLWEIPAFLRMDALMSREHMDVRSDRGDDGSLAFAKAILPSFSRFFAI